MTDFAVMPALGAWLSYRMRRGAAAQIAPCSASVRKRRMTQMFVRAVWRLKRLVDIKQTLREMDVPTTREGLGLSGTDFPQMTRSLFDR
jgi:hypothetical protein